MIVLVPASQDHAPPGAPGASRVRATDVHQSQTRSR
jgi:hypothetical protein